MNSIENTLLSKNILVTGGCGFIGSEVTKQLSEHGANITVIDNLSSGKEEYIQKIPRVELIKSDLSQISSFKSVLEGMDYVIHLAALPFIPASYYIPMKFFESNVNSTIVLALEVVKQKNIKKTLNQNFSIILRILQV